MALPQPVPPSWKDLGKSSNDLLGRDFPISALDFKTTTSSGVSSNFILIRDAKFDFTGDLKFKYYLKNRGITLTQTWTTANVLCTQVELENQIAKGLKFDLAALLDEKGFVPAFLTAIYEQPGLHTRASLNIFGVRHLIPGTCPPRPMFTVDTVFGRNGFLLGAEAAYDFIEDRITRYSGAIGFSIPHHAVTFYSLGNGNGSTFAASYYHRVSPDVEAGAKATHNTKATTPRVKFEVGIKTYLDEVAFVKAKINNAGILALGYTQALRTGVKASFGLAIDTQKLNGVSLTGPVHKVGASFTFEA